jgi:HlyD family secretion protein
MARSTVRSFQHRRSGRTLLTIVILLTILASGGVAWNQFMSGSDANLQTDAPLTTSVTRGSFDSIVLEQGEIESSSNIDVVNEVKARGSSGMTILWVIPEGSYIKKGDKLIELDSSGLQDELTAQRIKVLGAEALVISSEATVSTNEIALQEYLEGTYQSERKAILSEIDVAEQSLRKSELNLESARRLAAKGMLKGLQIEAEEFSLSNARNVLESAQARLKVLDELTREKNKVQLSSNIESSKAKLSSDRNVLAEEQSKQNEIEDLIKKCVILSPADGIVVYNNERSRSGAAEFMVKEGSVVRERQIILRLPDPGKMQVKAMVNESRIVKILPGMSAKVRVSAYPNEMLARVKRVNKYAEPGSWFSSSVKEYAAYLEIIDPPEAIRTGMSAEVRIYVEQLSDAIQVPIHGIYEFQGRLFCLKKEGPGWETIEVKIGASNEKFVTVTEGLNEGDEIALNPRNFKDLMKFPPDLLEAATRVELKKLAAEPMKQDAAPQGGPPGRGGPGGAGGRPGAGMPGAGGPGAGGPGAGGRPNYGGGGERPNRGGPKEGSADSGSASPASTGSASTGSASTGSASAASAPATKNSAPASSK